MVNPCIVQLDLIVIEMNVVNINLQHSAVHQRFVLFIRVSVAQW